MRQLTQCKTIRFLRHLPLHSDWPNPTVLDVYGQEQYAWCSFYTIVTRKRLEITQHIELFLEARAAGGSKNSWIC